MHPLLPLLANFSKRDPGKKRKEKRIPIHLVIFFPPLCSLQGLLFFLVPAVFAVWHFPCRGSAVCVVRGSPGSGQGPEAKQLNLFRKTEKGKLRGTSLGSSMWQSVPKVSNHHSTGSYRSWNRKSLWGQFKIAMLQKLRKRGLWQRLSLHLYPSCKAICAITVIISWELHWGLPWCEHCWVPFQSGVLSADFSISNEMEGAHYNCVLGKYNILNFY